MVLYERNGMSHLGEGDVVGAFVVVSHNGGSML